MEIKTYNLRSKEFCSASLVRGSEYNVIIRAEIFICCGHECVEGVGEVVETGVLCRRMQGKKVAFLDRRGVLDCVIGEYVEVPAIFCWGIEGEGSYYTAILALMVRDYIIENRYVEILHISENLPLCRILEKLLQERGVIVQNVSSEEELSLIQSRKFSVMLLGYTSSFELSHSIWSNAHSVIMYEKSCKLPVLDASALIYDSFRLKGLDVFKWLEGLSLLTRSLYTHYLRTSGFLLSSYLSYPFYQIQALEIFFSKPNHSFSASLPTTYRSAKQNSTLDCTSYHLSDSSLNDPQSLSSISITSLEDIIDPRCLEPPRAAFLPPILEPDSPSFANSQFVDRHLSLCSYDSAKSSPRQSIEDFSVVDYLQGLLNVYKNPEVMEILSQLPEIETREAQEEVVFLKMLPDYSIYQGDLNMKKEPHGLGTRFYNDGTVFRGYWEQGKAEGIGQLVTSDGFVYHGAWSDGLYSGYGSLRNKSGDYFEGIFEKGEIEGIGIEVIRSRGEKYHGNFCNGKRHGNGKLIYHNGVVFLGEFQDGSCMGNGKLFYNDKVFRGIFEGDSAEGVMEYKDGTKFYGKIYKLREEGKGVFEDIGFRKACYADQGVFAMMEE